MERQNEMNDQMRQQYEGKRIRFLSHHEADPRPLRPGQEGTCILVDAIGTLHMEWDDGRTLGLIPGIDQFEVLP